MNSHPKQRVASRTSVGMVLLLVPLFSSGCGPDPRAGRSFGPTKLPPAYPAAHDVSLDPQLRAEADVELQKDLRASSPELRAHAIEAVQETAGTSHTSEIIAALADPDPLVRYAAGLAAGELRLSGAHDQFLKMLDDTDAAVRVIAHFDLHRIGDYRYSHELEKLSRDPEARVRGTAAMVLGMLEDHSALKVLEGMRHDSHPAVRQEAAEAMWRLGSEEGLRDLIGWSVSGYQDDQKVALLALAAPHNRNVIQHVRAKLVTEVPEVNLVAARAMGMLGCDEGFGVALGGMTSHDPRERVLAALALGAIGRSDAQDPLGKLLADPSADVRIAAAQAILELKHSFHSDCKRPSV